eukprot:scpid94756/ scgid27352/ 
MITTPTLNATVRLPTATTRLCQAGYGRVDSSQPTQVAGYPDGEDKQGKSRTNEVALCGRINSKPFLTTAGSSMGPLTTCRSTSGFITTSAARSLLRWPCPTPSS